VVKAKTAGDCIQNRSDDDATYDAHKGRAWRHPLSGTKETWVVPFTSRPGDIATPQLFVKRHHLVFHDDAR